MRKVLILVLFVTLSPLSWLAAQSAAPTHQTGKLAVRLKATLPDYKGPSRFRGRKALITFSPDNRLVAMSGSNSTSVEFNNEGTILATANDLGVKLWDPRTGELLATLYDARYPVTFSNDGRILVTGGRKDTALLWELPQQSKRDSSQ